MAFVSFCLGCLNIPIHLMLLVGGLFRLPCLMLPWLAVTLLEHLVLGVPFIVFFGIISLYLAAQLELYLVAGALIGSVVMLFLLSLSSWFTVHSCYNMFYQRQDFYYESGAGVGTSSVEATQPLLSSSGSGRGRQSNGGAGYQLGQYPQYYPPHHNQGRALPSAPPGTNSMYPNLPT